MTTRQTIGYARSLRSAEAMLEDMFANGEISEGERPEIIGPFVTQYTTNTGETAFRYEYQITQEV